MAYDVFMPRASTRSRPELGRARGERHDAHRVEPLVLDRVRDYVPGTDATDLAARGFELRRRSSCFEERPHGRQGALRGGLGSRAALAAGSRALEPDVDIGATW